MVSLLSTCLYFFNLLFIACLSFFLKCVKFCLRFLLLLLLKTYLFYFKVRNTERGGKSFICWLTSQISTKARTGPVWSREPRASSQSPTWVLGSPRTWVFFSCFHGLLAGIWFRSWMPGLKSAPIWDTGTAVGGLAWKATVLAFIFKFFLKLLL